jgi:hypothetical protein
MVRTVTTYLKILGLGTLLTSCNGEEVKPGKCGCAPPPMEPVTTAQLVHTWQLEQFGVTGSPAVQGDAIKDRYQIKFAADGRYTQFLLADSTTYEGTWKLMGTDNRTLHLTDHKGVAQDYTMQGINTQVMLYGRSSKESKYELYTFKLIP